MPSPHKEARTLATVNSIGEDKPVCTNAAVKGMGEQKAPPAQVISDPWSALAQEKQYYALSSRARREVRRMSHEGTRPWQLAAGVQNASANLNTGAGHEDKGVSCRLQAISSPWDVEPGTKMASTVGVDFIRDAWQQRRQRRQQRTAERCTPCALDEDEH